MLANPKVSIQVGHTSTQMPQPVQSSGATCRLYIMPSSGPPSLRDQGTAFNVVTHDETLAARWARVLRLTTCVLT